MGIRRQPPSCFSLARTPAAAAIGRFIFPAERYTMDSTALPAEIAVPQLFFLNPKIDDLLPKGFALWHTSRATVKHISTLQRRKLPRKRLHSKILKATMCPSPIYAAPFVGTLCNSRGIPSRRGFHVLPTILCSSCPVYASNARLQIKRRKLSP